MTAAMNRRTMLRLMLLAFFAWMPLGCGGGGDPQAGGGIGGTGLAGDGKSGSLSLALQDAFSERYKGVYVTITEVQVHLGNDEKDDRNWRVVASPGKTYNLLELVNGVREVLGIADLEAGSYTQMRLIIGRTSDNGVNLLGRPHPFANYVITNPGDEIHELKVPSGFQTGIKIVHGFVIEENKTTELILDFDASKSVVRAGASGLWLLKPTIKVLETASYSIVRGTVEAREVATSTGSPLQGALVSAQQISDGNPEVIASTISGEDGKYALFIRPGTYNIVGSKTGFDTGCVQIATGAGETVLGADLVLLGPKETGTVTGRVFISDGASEQFVTLSFRKTAKCGDSPEETVIEIKSVNLTDGAPYSEELTPGKYIVHASTANHPAKSVEVTVVAGEVQVLDDFVL